MPDLAYHQNSVGRPFRVVAGDLVALAEARQFDVIGHGCNCFHSMGAGIAKTLARRFPPIALADKETPCGERAKLGTYSQARIPELDLTVLNIYSQFDTWSPMPRVDYAAIERAARSIAQEFPRKRLGLPMIGASMGGGDWLVIKDILGRELEAVDLTVVVFMPPDSR
jgi:O-acetyl-ADP-ribose deacetylase (regulator of RNase III)